MSTKLGMNVQGAVVMLGGRTRIVLVTLLGSIVLVAFLGIGWAYAYLAAPTYELNTQLTSMIRSHDVDEMKDLSLDDVTDKFLLGLPTNASVNASDFQGGGSPRAGVEIGYFPAVVGDQMLNCYMVMKTGPLPFMPRWKLVKVARSPVGIDPHWAD